jgi:hypothetical protein
MKARLTLPVLAACVALLAARQARAGIADSPLPVLTAGATTLHLYSVPGVIAGGGLDTFCLSGCFSYQRCGKALGRLPSSAAPRACSCNANSGLDGAILGTTDLRKAETAPS